MKKILVLFTGGTIGSTLSSNKEINVFKEETTNRVLISQYQKRYGVDKDIVFEEADIMNILSENMTVSRYKEMADFFKKVNFNNYDGIIMTHGTDTLGYTANYLSALLSEISIPLVLVSSNYVLKDPRENGVNSFASAIDLIKDFKQPGIYVSYSNNITNNIIYGSRVVQCRSLVDDFNSVNYKPLGYIEYGKFVINDHELVEQLCNREVTKGNANKNAENLGDLNKSIQIITPHVGLNYANIDLSKVDAILHTLYHSGTACVDGLESGNLIEFIKKCRNHEVDIFVGPIYGEDDRDLYQSTKAILENGGQVIMNCSIENIYAKLIVAYAMFKDKEKIMDFLNSDINFEHIMSGKKLVKTKR